MAKSKCASCGATAFESVQSQAKDYAHKLVFIQCAGCGAVVNAMSYYDAGIAAEKCLTALDAVQKSLAEIRQALIVIHASATTK